MTRPAMPHRPKPPRVTGAAHLFAAAGYSVGGLRRLWRETAFRHEVAVFGLAVLLFVWLGAIAAEFAALVGFFLLLIAIEALNTAIECIVDHLAPDWQEFARDAKDLGSLAVMCTLIGGGGFVAFVCARHILMI